MMVDVTYVLTNGDRLTIQMDEESLEITKKNLGDQAGGFVVFNEPAISRFVPWRHVVYLEVKPRQ